jgi:SNF2 family DNA or RNA helicase
MDATLEGKIIRLRFPYDPATVALVKTVPGRVWEPVGRFWTVPVARYREAREILGIELPGLSGEPARRDWRRYAEMAPATLGAFTLMSHQRAARAIAREHARFGFFLDTGTGKTPAALAIIQDAAPVKSLVVCPLALIRGAWEIDAKRFTPEIPFLDLHRVEKSKRAAALKRFMGIACINYESFKASVKDLAAWAPGILICDESSKLKTPSSDVSKVVRKFAASVPRAYLLSGTPAPNNELEYFVQGQILGAQWGKSYHGWRGTVAQASGYGGYQWSVTAKGQRMIQEDLAQVSWHVHKGDVLDLPERTFITRQVELTSLEARAYKAMAAKAVAEIEGQEISAPHVLTQLGKLRQGTSGFMYGPSDDGKAPVELWAGLTCSKVDALVDLLDEIGEDKPVVVWAHYGAEYRAIRAALGARCVEYTGRVSDNEKHDALTGWLAHGAPVLLASPASIGHGVTLTRASYAVFFSMSYSYEQYYQCCARIYRHGQRNACTYYHLVVPGTVDQVMLDIVSKKGVISSTTLEFLKGKTDGTGVR